MAEGVLIYKIIITTTASTTRCAGRQQIHHTLAYDDGVAENAAGVMKQAVR